MDKRLYIIIPRNEKYLEMTITLVSHFQKNLNTNIKPTIIVIPTKHIIESILSEIDTNSYVVWHPEVAANNLSLVKRYRNSVVSLKYQTVFNQRVSERNPINENMAINHNFRILYLQTTDESVETINNDFKTVLEEQYYTITVQQINKFILNE